jgi:voltage-gated potassium channel Kch
MEKITLRQRLRYAFDNTMSKGTPAMIAWLAVVSIVIILAAAVVLTLTGIAPEGEAQLGFTEAAWLSMMRTLDAGTMGGDTGWGFRLVQFAVTIGGIFIISTLIGALSSGIEAKLDELRKGRSMVCEEDHTLILGWSSKVATLISELVVANESRRNARIVVLADMDKVEMEEAIRDLVPDTKNTRVICRSGSPCSMQDLAIANPSAARSIIVLIPEEDSESDADGHTLKVILALTNNPNRRSTPYHVVAEIRDPRNLDVAQIVGKQEVELVLTDDLVSRIMVQTCRQSGLSVVYQELLDFDGAEIYMQAEPALVGRTFGEAIAAYEESAVMGLQYADGRVQVNPPHETMIAHGDRIIAITEDDDTLVVRNGAAPTIDEAALRNIPAPVEAPEFTLMLGWNRRSVRMLSELDQYVQPGSETLVVAEGPAAELGIELLQGALKKMKVSLRRDDPTSRRLLEELDPVHYHHILVLASSDELENEHADSRVLMTLLHLRHIQEVRGIDLNIVTEMMNSRNRDLAEITKADDFIVSDKMISLLMSQVSENKALMRVFDDLFESEGSEIYLKPIASYVATGEPVNYATAVEAAHRRGEIAIGYRSVSRSRDAGAAYGVVVNPAKSAPVTFAEDDLLIVLAED